MLSLHYKLQVFFLLVCLLFPFYALSAENSESTIQIYVNSSVYDKKYTLANVRAIFAMRKTHWNDGKRIRIFVLPDKNPLHRQFTKSMLKMFPHQFRRIWDRLVFSGTGQAPEEVESMEQMQYKLETVPHAIGYLNRTVEESNLRVLSYE